MSRRFLADLRQLRSPAPAAGLSNLRIGLANLGLAFGLTAIAMANVIGHASGCHADPSVSACPAVGKGFAPRALPPCIVARPAGTVVAAVLRVIAKGRPRSDSAAGSAAKRCTEHSPGGYSLPACLVAEVVLTFMFLTIILGATDSRAPQGFAPITIGLALTLIHLIGIPVTNVSVNPARSTAPALFVGGWALRQLWLSWVAPIAGALLAGILYRGLFEQSQTA